MSYNSTSDYTTVKPLSWVGITKNIQANNREEQDYCEYCLRNFHKYYQLVNNICTSCGRTPAFIKDVNAQEKVKLSAISDNIREQGFTGISKGVSLVMDYSEMLDQDITRSRNSDKDVARSAGEAIRLINQAEKRESKLYQSMQSPTPHIKFKVKTGNDKTFKSDNPNETEL